MLSKINILSNLIFRRLVLALALVLCTAMVSAQQKSTLPREHINVFWIMNFAKYVEWPNDTVEDFQDHWSGLPFPPSGDLPNLIETASLMSAALAGRFFTTRATWEAPRPAVCHTPSKFDPAEYPGIVVQPQKD